MASPINKKENQDIDLVDIKILNILMRNAMTPFTEIAKELVISGGTVHVRMKKMQDMGILKGSHLIVDPQKVGYDVCAFLGIYLENSSHNKTTVDKLKMVEEVVELHYTTGAYSLFAKIICRDTKHLREVLGNKIQTIDGIQRTETIISLEESITRQIRISEE